MPGKMRYWVPTRRDESAAAGGSTFVCNASGEFAGVVVSVPRTGTVTRFEFHMSAVGVAPVNGVRCSFQNVDSAGALTGGVDQSVTISSGSVTTGWINPGNFDSSRAVTAGEFLALIVDNPSFTAGDSFTLGGTVMTTDLGVPYSFSVLGTRSGGVMPYLALRYDDGTYEMLSPELPPNATVANFGNTQSDTTPDEIGQTLVVDRPCTMLGWSAYVQPGGSSTSMTVTLFDAAGNILTSMQPDPDISGNPSSPRQNEHFWPTPIVLRPGHVYTWSIKPDSSTVNLIQYHVSFTSQALADCYDSGPGWYARTRTNGGAWTDYNNGSDGWRHCAVSFLFEDFSGAHARSMIVGF